MRVMLSSDGNRPTYGRCATCPMTRVMCDPTCAWLMSDECGTYACAVPMSVVSDTFDTLTMTMDEIETGTP